MIFKCLLTQYLRNGTRNQVKNGSVCVVFLSLSVGPMMLLLCGFPSVFGCLWFKYNVMIYTKLHPNKTYTSHWELKIIYLLIHHVFQHVFVS